MSWCLCPNCKKLFGNAHMPWWFNRCPRCQQYPVWRGNGMFLALKDHMDAGTEREDISLLMRRIVYREGGMQNVLKELIGIVKEERGRKDAEYLMKLER